MAFDGLTTKAIVIELNKLLIGGKINKVYQPTKNDIVLDIYNKKKFSINICIESNNCRVNLGKSLKPNPQFAPNFCMVLRKYLIGAEIISIDTYKLDRIVIINFETYNELNDLVNYKLIIELMGKHSNVILINENNMIIDSIRHISSAESFRNILPANPYNFPVSTKLDLQTITLNEFINTINSFNNLINICCNSFVGISKPFMIFTLNKLNIDNENYTNKDLIVLYKYIQDVISCILNTTAKCVPFNLNKKRDFSISIESSSSSINTFIYEFYNNKEEEEAFIHYRNNILKLLLSILEKCNKKLITINQKLNECDNIDIYKLYGELITTYLYKLDKSTNLPSIILENYYDNNNLITIPLDKTYSLHLNAKNYFKKYNKLKNTLKIVTKQKNDIESDISYVESIVYSLNNCSHIEDINEIYSEISENLLLKSNSNTTKAITENKTKNNIQVTNIDDFNIYIGKNNKQNDYITFKLANKDDIWFHVQNYAGSHVLLKTNGSTILEDNTIILKCAKLAVINSKATGENKVLVNYTLVQNLKKPKRAKPGFVVFTNYKTIVVKND